MNEPPSRFEVEDASGPWQTGCFPNRMRWEAFYEPITGGYERAITERLRATGSSCDPTARPPKRHDHRR